MNYAALIIIVMLLSSGTYARSNRFGLTDINSSPFKNIQTIDYSAIKNLLNEYISNRPDSTPFLDQKRRKAWAENIAKTSAKNFRILDFAGDTSAVGFFEHLKGDPSFASKMRIEETTVEELKRKKTNQLFSYQIFSNSFVNKPSILIWAKEHGDEFSTAEFVNELTEFFIFHLESRGRNEVNLVVQDIFSRINIVVIPDMNPDKTVEAMEAGTIIAEDFNAFGQLLQPFNYDSDNSDDYVVAPEARFFKKVATELKDVILGIDLHAPFSTPVMTYPHKSIEEKNRFLIAEASNTSFCQLNLGERKISEECQTGKFRTSHPQVSFNPANAPSFLSRSRGIPTMLLEISGEEPSDPRKNRDCEFAGKDKTCAYYSAKPHLKDYLPFFLRLMEIMGYWYEK